MIHMGSIEFQRCNDDDDDGQNLRVDLTRKVLYLLLFVMNLIWLMLIITHIGLILFQQFMFLIPCMVLKT